MTYASFWNQCLVFGDQNLSPNERWKSIKYISTPSQSAYAIDVQILLAANAIHLINNDYMKAFIIKEVSNPDFGLFPIEAETLIQLHSLSTITFVMNENEVIDINELIENNKNNLMPDSAGGIDYLYELASKKFNKILPDGETPFINSSTNKIDDSVLDEATMKGDTGITYEYGEISGEYNDIVSGNKSVEIEFNSNTINKVQTDSYNFKFNMPIITPPTPKVYGVRFIGGTNPGTRTGDAVGKVAGVGTDIQTAVNDFDNIYPWSARKRCCGMWNTETNEFIVNAYAGEPGYAVDGSNGEVWVEHSIFYYKHTNDEYGENIEISPAQLPGFNVAPIFINPNNENAPFEKAYTAAYPMATIDGKATSRSGVFSDLYSLNSGMITARTLGNNYCTTRTAEWYTECLYMWVEFATRNMQAIMTGATTMAYRNNYVATATETMVNRIIVSNNTAALFVVGQTIGIGTELGTTNITNNRIVTVIQSYDTNNMAIYFDGQAVTINVDNIVFSRPWINGSCDSVVTSSGSPVSNTSLIYNCMYRGKETPYGNAFEWISDMLFLREGAGTGESPYAYTSHYLPDATKYNNGTITTDYVKMNYNIPAVDGYIKTLGYDSRFPWVRIPSDVGSSASTYYSDYYYFPQSTICAGRVGGYWSYSLYTGPSSWYCYNAPSSPSITGHARLSYFRK